MPASHPLLCFHGGMDWISCAAEDGDAAEISDGDGAAAGEAGREDFAGGAIQTAGVW